MRRVAVEVRRESQGKGGPVTFEESKRDGEMVQTLRRVKAGASQGHSASRLSTGSWERVFYDFHSVWVCHGEHGRFVFKCFNFCCPRPLLS